MPVCGEGTAVMAAGPEAAPKSAFEHGTMGKGGQTMSFRLFLTSLALLLTAPLTAAQAAPQILALITTNGATPLTCADGVCAAEFSAFCMEPDRAGPGHKSPYRLADTPANSDLTLVARTSTGEELRLPVGDDAQFESLRGYAAVRISLPQRLLAELDATALAIEVGADVALLPVALPSHHRPHKPEQIARALGPNRAIGADIVDNGGAGADTARLLNGLINALPAAGPVAAEARQSLWTHGTSEIAPALLESGGDRAKHAYDSCLAEVSSDGRFSLRRCLEHAHDYAMWELNRRYWLAVGDQS